LVDRGRVPSRLHGLQDLKERMMSTPFKGKINVDIRDSVPDWAPFEPPKAPEGAPIETPNIDRIAGSGVRYTQWHTTALCSPTRSCLLTGRNHTRNSMACITEAASGFPSASGVIPPENGQIQQILSERWLEHVHGRQVASVPGGRDEPRLLAAQLAERARL
jgi:arylsulfatase